MLESVSLGDVCFPDVPFHFSLGLVFGIWVLLKGSRSLNDYRYSGWAPEMAPKHSLHVGYIHPLRRA